MDRCHEELQSKWREGFSLLRICIADLTHRYDLTFSAMLKGLWGFSIGMPLSMGIYGWERRDWPGAVQALKFFVPAVIPLCLVLIGLTLYDKVRRRKLAEMDRKAELTDEAFLLYQRRREKELPVNIYRVWRNYRFASSVLVACLIGSAWFAGICLPGLPRKLAALSAKEVLSELVALPGLSLLCFSVPATPFFLVWIYSRIRLQTWERENGN
jgi:hypothetical protein